MDPAVVEWMSFGVDIHTFVTTRAAPFPGPYDWSSDGCSTPLPVGLGDTGRSYNFRAPCQRHDFGYRNFRLLDAAGAHGQWWNETTRRRIDDQFLTDMLASCAPRPWTQRTSCRAWARVYHRAGARRRELLNGGHRRRATTNTDNPAGSATRRSTWRSAEATRPSTPPSPPS